MNNFNIEGIPKLNFGAGKISDLPSVLEKFGKNVLLLTGGSSLKKSGIYEKIKISLKEFRLFEAFIKGEPSPKIINEIVFNNFKNSINSVCAIGGGSVLDAGKAVSAMLKQDNFISIKDYLEVVGTKTPSGTKLPFIAVPTTAGTGSEATKNAVISEPGINGFKSSLRHDNYIPDLAIIDPELTLDCPASVTAAAGLDALSQLLESYISTKANPFTDSLAEKAIIGILHSLIPLCNGCARDLEKRSYVSYGAFVSGVTLAHAGLGTVHGMAGFIGGIKNIPHGVICGLLLPYWLEKTVEIMMNDQKKYKICLKKLYTLSQFIFENGSTAELVKLFVQYTKDLCFELKLPKLKTFGITEKDLELFAEKSGNKNNPVVLNYQQKLEILKKAY